MNRDEFSYFRKKLGKTQREIAELLGTSLKAVHSYEQGWRNVPVHVERQLLFLFSKKLRNSGKLSPCWKVKKCLPDQKRLCPAWEFKTGDLCWFINGTICEGSVHKDWREKIKVCRGCEVFTPLLPE
jgi:DNA-binding XRE family transcriptional regulator